MNNQDRIPARCKSNDYEINARARIDSWEDLKDTRLREFYSKQKRITRINSEQREEIHSRNYLVPPSPRDKYLSRR